MNLNSSLTFLRILSIVAVGIPSSSAFFFRWPFSFGYPGTSTTTVSGAASATSINHGFLRPGGIILPIDTTTTTTTAATTTTTEAENDASTLNPLTQLILTVLLSNAISGGNNRPPSIGGVAQPYPVPVPVPLPSVPVSGGGGVPFPGGGVILPGGLLPRTPASRAAGNIRHGNINDNAKGKVLFKI